MHTTYVRRTMRARTSPKVSLRSPGVARRSGEDDASRRVTEVVGAPEGDFDASTRVKRATPDNSRFVAFGSSSPSPSEGKENSPYSARRVTPSRSAEQMRRVEAACARAGVASPGDSRRRGEHDDGLVGPSFRHSLDASGAESTAVHTETPTRHTANTSQYSPSSTESPATPQSGPRSIVKAPQPSPRVMPSAMLKSAVEAAAEASLAAEAASDASFEEAKGLSPSVSVTYQPTTPDPLRSILGYLDAVDLESSSGSVIQNRYPNVAPSEKGRQFSVRASVAAIRGTYNVGGGDVGVDRVPEGFDVRPGVRLDQRMSSSQSEDLNANTLSVATSAYEGVKQKLEELRKELSRRDNLIRKLEAELRVSYDRAAANTAVQLAEQRAANETQTQRHLGLAETLLADKSMLTEECAKLSESLGLMEARHASAIEKERLAFQHELKRHKQKWEDERVTWETEKTKEVKELTIRGLEPEIQRLVMGHRVDLKNRETQWREEMLARDMEVQQRHAVELLSLKNTLHTEMHESLELERDAARVRLDELSETYERKIAEVRKTLSDREQSQSDQYEKGRRDERLRSADTIKQLQDEATERETKYEKSLQMQKAVTEKRHAAELKALQLRLDEESQTFKSRVAAKARESVKAREADIMNESNDRLNREIEAVAAKLRNETAAGRYDADRELLHRAERAERDVSVARETIERLEREVELTKTTTFEDTRVTALTLQLEQAEQRARHLEETLHRNETKRDLETQALEHRVRAAIGAKDETIAKLSVQLQDLRGLME